MVKIEILQEGSLNMSSQIESHKYVYFYIKDNKQLKLT